jgi:tetratricopeptide (TPR) repeat protein
MPARAGSGRCSISRVEKCIGGAQPRLYSLKPDTQAQRQVAGGFSVKEALVNLDGERLPMRLSFLLQAHAHDTSNSCAKRTRGGSPCPSPAEALQSLMMTRATLALAAALLLGGAGADSAREESLWRHRNLGKAYFETPTTLPQAVTELKQALDLTSNSFRDRLNYGLALLRVGDLRAAEAELERAQKQQPAVPHTWFNLGIAYKRESRYADAIRQFEGMARLAPDEPVTRYNLGLLYNLTGRPEDALREFQKAAALDANLVAPRYQLYNALRLQGDEQGARKALAEFQSVKAAQTQSGDSEDMEWCYYAELYDSLQAMPAPSSPAAEVKIEERKLSGSVDARTAGLLAIDAFGENKTDLLVWSRDGIRLYRGGAVAAASGLETLKGVINVAAGDFDNDGLADLCVLTEAGPLLFRNTKGRFEKVAAALPAGRFEAALWVDFDHDYDVDLFLFGEQSALLRNENGVLREDSQRFPFAPRRAIDAVAFRVVPDTKASDIAVSYAGHASVLYRDDLRERYRATPLDAVPAGARSLQAADLDNDGWIDLASTAGLAFNRSGRFEAQPLPAPAAGAVAFLDWENRGFEDLVSGGAIYRNLGLRKFGAPARPAGLAAGAAFAVGDFDADGRDDLAAVSTDGTLRLLANRTETKNRSLTVALVGVKNVKSAAATEVEVKSAGHYQKKSYAGVPLVFGLGPRAAVDTVRITWPNGMIQNQPDETARVAVIKEAPRMSGSCPMVFAWNGREFQFISDVLGVAPLGASSGDGNYFPVDSDEYLQLPSGALAPRNGRYEIRVTEELHEVSYIDEARLVTVDHPDGIEIFTNDKFKSPPFPEFRLFGVKRRIYPEAARDGNGRDVLASLIRRDRSYAAGFRRDMAGRAEMHSLELTFPAGAARDNRAVLILNGWIDWADGSTFLAASQGGPGLVMPYLQVKDSAGRWQTVIEDLGVPSGGPKTIAVDLTGKFLSKSRKVRIVTNVCLYWDEVFLSEDTTRPLVRMSEAGPADATLGLRGFSRAVVDARREQPETYEYAHREPEAMWNPVPGLYTRYGDASMLVRAADDRFVIMGSGDELRLAFDASRFPPLQAGWTREFLLLVDGWSKDADANTAFAESVEPLPFHGMSQYPYPASEHFPDDAEHRAWREQYNIRRGVRLMDRLARAGR